MGDILTYRVMAEGVIHPCSQQGCKHRKISVDEDGSQQDIVIRNISDVLARYLQRMNGICLISLTSRLIRTSLRSIDKISSNLISVCLYFDSERLN
jgi:hypothetical protein